jgi:Ca-activated chloride channel homolog
MAKTRIAVAAALALVLAVPAFAQSARLAQIDTSRLLLSQTVRLYVSVTDPQGRPVEGLRQDMFSVSESADGQRFVERPLTGFVPRAAAVEGIEFLLLIDNSGSMYDTIAGKPTTDAAATRITAAKDAVRSFLGAITHPADTVGLVAYNTLYAQLASPQKDKARVAAALDAVARPEPDQAYTELHASLARGAAAFGGAGGRKAIVVLSDGQNYPFARYAGKPHPETGMTIATPEEAILACQEQGVSIYAINFGADKDPDLARIAAETGGTVFDAGSREELQGVYRRIHEQVAGEYLVTYRAGMAPAERTFVRVGFAGAQPVTRFYFSSTVFGLPAGRLSAWLLLPLFAALAALYALTLLKLESKRGPATLEVLATRVGRAQTRVVSLSGTKTVIGGSTQANLTLTGNPSVKEEHATILFDPKKKTYTIAGTGDITVNNQPTRTRRLEAGDVINVGGATIVFDDGEEGREG